MPPLLINSEDDMNEMQKVFESWFTSGGVNKINKLKKTENGKFYIDKTTDSAWFCFKAGYCHDATKDI